MAMFMLLFVALVYAVAPWAAERRRRRARRVLLTESYRIAPRVRASADTHAPHWTRDPSPKPRKVAS